MRIELVFALIYIAPLSGCLNDGSPPLEAPGIGEVVVFERGPHLAQCAPVAITLRQSAAKLTRSGIDVRGSSCGHIEGVMHPAVCGGGTNEILVHDIPAGSLDAARGAGFEPVDMLPDWRRASCPHFLHAIEVAQEATSCVEDKNRVMLIQSEMDPGQRWTLLDQAGACADASYRQVLYGPQGDNALCSNADSIAGPRRDCVDGASAEMFDTIVSNLDKTNLGLGAAYRVGQIFPQP